MLHPSVASQWFATQFLGWASRRAALLLARILPVSSLVAPCDPGAAPGTYATIHCDGTLCGEDDLADVRSVLDEAMGIGGPLERKRPRDDGFEAPRAQLGQQ